MISVNKVFFLANGVFGIERITLPEPTIASVLEHLGVTQLGPLDKAEIGEGDVVVELAQKEPWTYNRYVFSLRQM